MMNALCLLQKAFRSSEKRLSLVRFANSVDPVPAVISITVCSGSTLLETQSYIFQPP